MISFIADKNRKLSKSALENSNGLSFSALMKLIRNKDVKVNGKRINKDVSLNAGDLVEIYYNPIKQHKYDEIFSDENVLVVNKKSGFTSEEVYEDILIEDSNAKFIHRLDRNTTGIMIFAKTELAEKELLKGFKDRTFIKEYKATVFGKMPKDKDVLTAYLVKDAENSFVKIYDARMPNSVEIKTGYNVLSYDNGVSNLSVTLYTGKTHQIRAHLAHVGHPIVGDGKYGDNVKNKEYGAKTQKLCAYKLTLKFDDKSPLKYLSEKTFTI